MDTQSTKPRSTYDPESYARMREAHLEKQKAYYQRTKEARLKYQNEYNAANPKAYDATKISEESRLKTNERKRAYYHANKEAIAEKQKAYYAERYKKKHSRIALVPSVESKD